MTVAVSADGLPALVLNADYRPLSYYPLSLWSWQDAIKAVFLDRVNIVAEYEQAVSSPTFSMRLPSVVSLKAYVKPMRHPAFTRFNVFLRDGDTVYRTWHTDGRGTEQLGHLHGLVDVLPYGRQEAWEDSPHGWPQHPTYEGGIGSPGIAALYGPGGSAAG